MSGLSPSRFILESIQKHVPEYDLHLIEGVPSDESIPCSACGVTIQKGDPVIKPSLGDSFTDWQYLIHPGAVHLCTHCATCFGKAFLQSFQTSRAPAAVFSQDGAWLITKDQQRHWFLLNPPKPPFVAYIAMTNNQHLVWRAPFTMDTRVVKIAHGRSTLIIHRERLFKASEICFEITEQIRKDGIKINTNHPFISLSRDMDVDGYGRIRADILTWMIKKGMKEKLRFLESLNEGELWGLGILNKSKPEIPQETTINEYFLEKKTQKAQKTEGAQK